VQFETIASNVAIHVCNLMHYNTEVFTLGLTVCQSCLSDWLIGLNQRSISPCSFISPIYLRNPVSDHSGSGNPTDVYLRPWELTVLISPACHQYSCPEGLTL